MPINFSKVKIYKIVSSQTDDVYISYTVQQTSKLMCHLKANYRNYLTTGKTKNESINIMKYDDAKIVLLEDKPNVDNIEDLDYIVQQYRDEHTKDLKDNKRKAMSGLDKKQKRDVYNPFVKCSCGHKFRSKSIEDHLKTARHQTELDKRNLLNKFLETFTDKEERQLIEEWYDNNKDMYELDVYHNFKYAKFEFE